MLLHAASVGDAAAQKLNIFIAQPWLLSICGFLRSRPAMLMPIPEARWAGSFGHELFANLLITPLPTITMAHFSTCPISFEPEDLLRFHIQMILKYRHFKCHVFTKAIQGWGTVRVFASGLQFTHLLMPFAVACFLLHVNLRDICEDALFSPVCSLENMLACLVNLTCWLDGHLVSTARGKPCSCLQGDDSLGGDPTDFIHHFLIQQDMDPPKYVR